MNTYLAALEEAERFAVAEGRLASVVYDTAVKDVRARRGYVNAELLSEGVVLLHVVTPDGFVWSLEDVHLSVCQQLNVHITKREPERPEEEPQTMQEIQDWAVTRALARHNGDKPRAAKELGIALKTLYNRINRKNEGER